MRTINDTEVLSNQSLKFEKTPDFDHSDCVSAITPRAYKKRRLSRLTAIPPTPASTRHTNRRPLGRVLRPRRS
jgi:hypothetical protein